MDITEAEIADLGQQAQAAATQHLELQSAIAEERQAEAAVVERVLVIAQPALRALSSRIPISYAVHHQGDVNYDQAATYEYLTERGVYLDTDEGGPGENDRRANSGSYGGCDAFLLTDGRLAWLTYTGAWSRWQGSSSEWTAAIEYVPASRVATALVKRNRGPRAIAALRQALAAQLDGNAARQTAAARERAARLRAIDEAL